MANINININTKQPKHSGRQVRLMIFSFRLMRVTVGVLGLIIGILLPLITALVTQCFHIQESISHYYYTIAGDVFVGLLCAVAFFLISYPGNGEWEDIWTNVAGGCAVGVAFFPTSYRQLNTSCTKFSYLYPDFVSWLHLGFAAAFFLILGYVAFCQFPVPGLQQVNGISKRRKLFYKGCGLLMWACILALSPMLFSDSYKHFLSVNKLVFALEVVALLAFGTCWFIKGTEK